MSKHVHEHLIAHLHKTAEHSKNVSIEHQGFAELHRDRAQNCKANDDTTEAEYHEKSASHHSTLAEHHAEHAQHCQKAAVEVGDAFGDGTSSKAIQEQYFAKIFGG